MLRHIEDHQKQHLGDSNGALQNEVKERKCNSLIEFNTIKSREQVSFHHFHARTQAKVERGSLVDFGYFTFHMHFECIAFWFHRFLLRVFRHFLSFAISAIRDLFTVRLTSPSLSLPHSIFPFLCEAVAVCCSDCVYAFSAYCAMIFDALCVDDEEKLKKLRPKTRPAFEPIPLQIIHLLASVWCM